MTSVRLGIDLEPLADLSLLWKDLPLDLLDFAYAAGTAGAQMLMAPEGKLETSELTLLARPGLPFFVLKVREGEFAKVMASSPPADRLFVVGDYGGPLKNGDDFEKFTQEMTDAAILGAFVEAEPGTVKKAARAAMSWVVFSTTPYAQAPTIQDAEDELARLSTAILAAQKFDLRVAVMGAIYPHQVGPLLKVEGIEEIYLGPEIWLRALRVGWDRALNEYHTAINKR